MPLERQAQEIAELKANPEGGYGFFGPAGWSKSTFAIALYRDALWKFICTERWYDCCAAYRSPVMRLSTPAWIEEYRKYKTADTHRSPALRRS
jgi:hypothetical protein